MNSRKKLISCIIIFFNAGEQFFIEAIESVFAQTYEDWELLLVDDGSTDSSTEIALGYTQKYPEKVHYLEHEDHQNRGMSATRNLGIRHAKGEYITFLDADDIWLPNTLEEQAAILDSHTNAAMVYGPIQWWYSWTGNFEDTGRDFLDTPIAPVSDSKVNINSLVQPPTLFLLLLEGKICISGMLMQRQAVERVGGFEEQFRGLYEDQVFCSKICLQFPVFVTSKWWYKYRQHPNSCCVSTKKTKTEYFARGTFLNWLEQYLSKGDFKYTEVWQVFQKELWLYRYPIFNYLVNIFQSLTNIKSMKWHVKLMIQRKLLAK
jgi:glycosyltransferase involved in cell wall biosynthesis